MLDRVRALASLLSHYRCPPDFSHLGNIANVLTETTDKQVDSIAMEAAGDDFGWPDTDALGLPQRLIGDAGIYAAAGLPVHDPRAAPCFRGVFLSHEQWWMGSGVGATPGGVPWESATWAIAADHDDSLCAGLAAPDAGMVSLAQRRPIDHWRVHSHSLAALRAHNCAPVVPKLDLER